MCLRSAVRFHWVLPRLTNTKRLAVPLPCETGCSALIREPPPGGNFKEARMKKLAVVLMLLAVVALLAPAAFAQEAGAKGGSGHTGLLAIAAGLGMGLPAFGGAVCQGRVGGAACGGVGWRPRAG